MDLNIIRKEVLGSGVNSSVETEEIHSFEIMDGCPIKGNYNIEEEIPIRMFLAGTKNLTPSMQNINNKFSVQYFLNLVMTDDQGRKYFKQNEIILLRRPK